MDIKNGGVEFCPCFDSDELRGISFSDFGVVTTWNLSFLGSCNGGEVTICAGVES